jgi:hypothetical protein
VTLAVVNLGLPKSGTTTLAKALRLAGFTFADHRLRGRNTPDPARDRVAGFLGRDLPWWGRLNANPLRRETT